MITLRDYQIEISRKGLEILKQRKIVYLSMQVRTGKTLTSLEIARLYGAFRVLFITKKKAISFIEKDYQSLNPPYDLDVINYESLHKVDAEYDLVIIDEAHRIGGYPKPGLACKIIREKFAKKPIIFLSGTPSPESYSQLYHQFWVSAYSPFSSYFNFYKWAYEYVDIETRMINGHRIRDYKKAKWESIEPILAPYMISYTQAEAGFQVELKEHFITVPMDPKVHKISSTLLKDNVIQGKSGIISACNPAVLQQKIHQIHSGTIILDPENEGEKGKILILSLAKAETISETFPEGKLVIFYQFQAELSAIVSVLGDRVTTDIEEFNKSDKSYAGQFVSSREGINLSKGDLIIAYNISFSATTYQQFRDRLTTIDRRSSDIYWLFSEGGIEEKIYRAVIDKKNYTLEHFKKDFHAGIPGTKEFNQAA